MRKIDENNEAEFIRGLLSEEKTVSMARARIDAAIEFLGRAKSSLSDE
jgi:hypothetical protein